METLDRRIPILAFRYDQMLIQALFMPNQNVDLTRCSRPSREDDVVLNRNFSRFVKLTLTGWPRG